MTNRNFAGLLLALAAASSLSGCTRDGPRSGNGANDVRKAALGIVAAYNAQDAHATAAFDAPDYVGMYHGTANTSGPAADEAAMKAQMAQTRVEWRLGHDMVTIGKGGDLVVFEAPYTFLITPAQGAVMRETGNWVAIFKRQKDGSMKLWRSIASDTPAAAATATAATR